MCLIILTIDGSGILHSNKDHNIQLERRRWIHWSSNIHAIVGSKALNRRAYILLYCDFDTIYPDFNRILLNLNKLLQLFYLNGKICEAFCFFPSCLDYLQWCHCINFHPVSPPEYSYKTNGKVSYIDHDGSCADEFNSFQEGFDPNLHS
jgi:hypothetical protein